MALGAAYYSDQTFDLEAVANALQERGASETYRSQPPLFSSKEEYEAPGPGTPRPQCPGCRLRRTYAAPVHIGIDSGSTTVKIVVVDQDARLLFTDYRQPGQPRASHSGSAGKAV